MLGRSLSLTPSLWVVVFSLSLNVANVSNAQDEPRPEPSFPTLSADAPAGTGVIQPCLEELEGGVRCGRYRVYEDREAGSGRTIDLGFVVADALDPHSRQSDAVTYFFGGPGSPVTPAAPFVIPFHKGFRQNRDLLFLDFRGVGASQPLDCAVPYPRGVESRFGEIFPLDQIEACRDRLEQQTQLNLYTSAINMDDLDELRAWLNYTTLNLNGGSYGSKEIQIFMRRHPESVRTAVLNGVVPIFGAGYISHAKGLQNALDGLVVECLGQPTCSAAYPNLEATATQVLRRVREDPPEVVADETTVRLGPGEFGYALRGLLYRRGAEVPKLLTAAAQGDWQPLADYYLARSGWVSQENGEAGMHFSVICAEDISQVDDESIARETASTFLGDYLIGGYKRVCESWPYARLDASFWEPVKSDIPSLLLSGSRDPVTPPAGGEAVAKHLSNHLHIVVPGGAHGVSGPCLNAIETELVETGTVEGLDTSCLEERPPTEFVLPEAEG